MRKLLRYVMSCAHVHVQAKLEPLLGRPSRVVHLRNVPSDATEQEILSIGMPFGAMTNLVLAKKKNQVRTDIRVQSGPKNLPLDNDRNSSITPIDM